MAMRRTACPECGSYKITTLEVRPRHNSRLPNDDATLKCDDCSHQWEGSVTNTEKLAKLRRRGVRI